MSISDDICRECMRHIDCCICHLQNDNPVGREISWKSMSFYNHAHAIVVETNHVVCAVLPDYFNGWEENDSEKPRCCICERELHKYQ